MIAVRTIVASALTAALAYVSWSLLDVLLGRSLPAQIISVGVPITAAIALYARLVLVMRIPEARQIEELVLSRLGRA
jgi:predicted RND superfamily exporter protein